MQLYREDPPPSHFLRSILRRFRRILKGSPRQQLLILLVWILLLSVALRISQKFGSGINFAPSNILGCDSPRDRLSQSLPIPQVTAKKALSQIWSNLHKVFDSHPPQPLTLGQPKFQTGGKFPDIELIRNQLKISPTDAQATRDSHIEVTKNLLPYPSGVFSGRGIVMLAGGKYSGYAATGLGMLRELGSTLPVEVWMKDQSEEKPGWCDELEQEGMACRKMSDYMNVSFMAHGYQLKVNSILLSSFEEVLFLDADNVPVRNPDGIFDSKGYSDTGAVLWKDYWRHSGAPILPYILGITDEASEVLIEETEKTVESGQLIWDKKRHWKSLCLATYYNYYGPQHYYTLISQGWAGWGDKDTFPMALRSLHQEYYLVPHDLKTLFVNGTAHGIGMLQADPTNHTHYQPMFLHSNVIKWGIRAFLCSGCGSDPVDPVSASAIEKSDSSINLHLKEHYRIFKEQDMKAMGIDPEPLIWKSMEHTACRSVWKNDGLCTRTREHMEKTFESEFRPNKIAGLLGYDHVCVMNEQV